MTITRRDFLRIIAVGGAAGLTTKFSVDALRADQLVCEPRILMGTIVNLQVVAADKDSAQAAVQACINKMAALEKVLSRFIPESELSQLNRRGSISNPDPALREVVQEALRFSQLSNGAFDISIKPILDALQSGRDPSGAARATVGYRNIRVNESEIRLLKPHMSLTLDGIAKGYIVDQGVAVLRELGFANVMVEAGGDLIAGGHRADGKPWRLGIADPRAQDGQVYLTSFSVTEHAVATSGDYVQHFDPDKSQHHIIDPSIGISPSELASVTVLAPTAMQADAFSTTVMVLGAEMGLTFIDQQPGVEALLVTKDCQMYPTDNFPD